MAADRGDFSADHFLAGIEDVAKEGFAGLVEVGGVSAAAAECEDCLAEGFAWDGAGIDHRAADGGSAFDDADGFAEFGSGDSSSLSTSAGADHDEVIRVHVESAYTKEALDTWHQDGRRRERKCGRVLHDRHAPSGYL